MPKGRTASPDELHDAGFKPEGIEKNSLGAGMMSDADKHDNDRGIIPDLQSAGAKGQPFTGEKASRDALDSSGFSSGGVKEKSVGSNAMSEADKSKAGKGVVSAAQSAGATK